MSDLLRRIEREIGTAGLSALLADRLKPSDLHSLLIEVFRLRSETSTPAGVLADYTANPFVQPSPIDQRVYAQWDAAAFAALPAGFSALELSPLTPLGSNAAIATVSQNKTLVTTRSLEVVSDPTNVLALECALRRRTLLKTSPRSTEAVHLAASQRVVRPHFPTSPHFRLFSTCTAGRTTGGNQFELAACAEHLGFYLTALRAFLGAAIRLRVLLTDLVSDIPRACWEDELLPPLRAAHPEVAFLMDQTRTTGRGYYRDVCFKLHAARAGEFVEIGDGGSVDWPEKLLGSTKERLFIAGCGSDRVCGFRS